MRKNFVWILVYIMAALVNANYSFGSIPALPENPSTSVVDLAGIINDADKTRLTDYLRQLEVKTSTKMMIVTIQSLEGESIENFSSRARATWKLNQSSKDNAVLLSVATKDRKYRIDVGYGLESKLPDALVGDIGRTYLVPYFKSNNYSTGLLKTTEAVIQTIAPHEIIRNGEIPHLEYSASPSKDGQNTNINIVAFIPSVILCLGGFLIFLISPVKKFAIIGYYVGGLLGFLLRPSVFLVGQLPFGAVISRGAALSGLDLLLVPAAQNSFNVIVAVAIIGALIGAGIEYFLLKKKSVQS